MSSARLSLLPETSSIDNVEMPEDWHEEGEEVPGIAQSGGEKIKGSQASQERRKGILLVCCS